VISGAAVGTRQPQLAPMQIDSLNPLYPLGSVGGERLFFQELPSTRNDRVGRVDALRWGWRLP
jgi:hypothetical protein